MVVPGRSERGEGGAATGDDGRGTQRANALWKRLLREYEAPPIDPGVDEALTEFIAKKKAAVPDSNV